MKPTTMDVATGLGSSPTATQRVIDEQVSVEIALITGLVKPEIGRTHRNIARGELFHEQAGIFATHGCYECGGIDGILQSN